MLGRGGTQVDTSCTQPPCQAARNPRMQIFGLCLLSASPAPSCQQEYSLHPVMPTEYSLACSLYLLGTTTATRHDSNRLPCTHTCASGARKLSMCAARRPYKIVSQGRVALRAHPAALLPAVVRIVPPVFVPRLDAGHQQGMRTGVPLLTKLDVRVPQWRVAAAPGQAKTPRRLHLRALGALRCALLRCAVLRSAGACSLDSQCMQHCQRRLLPLVPSSGRLRHPFPPNATPPASDCSSSAGQPPTPQRPTL